MTERHDLLDTVVGTGEYLCPGCIRAGATLRPGCECRTNWYAEMKSRIRHGSRARYRKGCGCSQCLAAERNYRRQYRARKKAEQREGLYR